MHKAFKQYQNGFTLIEVMIVIAIIGILAGIAIPNFIAYRDKSFCSGAESDANNIARELSDYYAIPTHATLTTGALPTSDITTALTKNNTAIISGNINAIVITVTDGSGRCPNTYMTNHPNWTAATSVFIKTIQ